MKTQTKQTILKWVKKLIHYDETKDTGPFIIKEQRYIPQLIKHEHIYTKENWEYACQKESLRIHVALAMAHVLVSPEVNAIKIEYEPDMQSGGIKLTAKLTYLEPR